MKTGTAGVSIPLFAEACAIRVFTVFDAHVPRICTARRNHSDTPLQALTTLNDPAFFEAAQAMARRIEKEGG